MLYFTILVILSVIAIAMWLNDGEISAFFTAILLVLWICCGVGSHFCHVENLAVVETQEQIILIQSDKVERLRVSLGQLKTSGDALLNADTPMAKLIEEIALAEKALADAKIELVLARRSIIAREKSLFSFVV